MRACFVTGTDTEIGKTLVSSALLHVLNQSGASTLGIKPIASGAEEINGRLHNEDVNALARHSSLNAAPETLTPYLFKPAAAPHILAEQAGIELEPTLIQKTVQAAVKSADYVVVEGVGGFMLPLGQGRTGVDLAQALQLPVVLVVGLRLGALNHALLTAQAIRTSGLHLLGWVANHIAPEMSYAKENLQTLHDYLPGPCLGVIPRLNATTLDDRIQQAAHYLRSPWEDKD
ncbi:dethiobiotin synthase [Alcaligenes aquatilis]|jgi:dethiobiotin synthetase|uniref:ATP-dependent dethiobiotin synthetase BioD n=1 Tax=Alcaligenes faecalis TaxID=511 RepID=A0AB33CQ39_ALCFA|nr:MULTISPECIES: dethiobiotin synthase [Alcaligenes]ASR88745.1 dethiobiotin synthase [Alcaligenes faecalis]MCC9163959.1 dethiobiotin synthase [Alcaligenes sp. MMA]